MIAYTIAKERLNSKSVEEAVEKDYKSPCRCVFTYRYESAKTYCRS